MPEFRGVDGEIEALSDRLVSDMQSPLNDAIAARDAEAAQRLTGVFRKVGRESRIRESYISLRQRPFQQFWETHVVSTAEAAPLGDRLNAFYDIALRTLKEESAWLLQAFPAPMEPRSLACAVLTGALGGLADGMRRQLDLALQQAADQGSRLARLIEYHELVSRFARNVQQSLRGADEGDLGSVVVALFTPFFGYEREIGQLLQEEMTAPAPTKKLFGDVVRAVEDEVRRLFLSCDGAVSSCLQFSGGAGATPLLAVLNDAVAMYAGRIEAVIGKARGIMGLPEPVAAAVAGSGIGSCGSGRESGSGSAKRAGRAGGVSSMRVPEDKWARFQHAMLLAQSTHSATKRLTAFEADLRRSLRSVRDALLDGTATALKECKGGPDSSASACAALVPPGLLHMATQRDSLRKLRALLHSLDDTHYRLLSGAARRLGQVHADAQRFVFDVMYEPIRGILDAYSSLVEWTAVPPPSEYDNVDLPTFSQSPTASVTAVGEYMITLPQQLEPFEGSGFPIDPSALGPGIEPASQAGFGAQWLSFLAFRTAGEFVLRLLDVQSVSETGRRQMQSDVGYVASVLTALGMPSMPALAQLVTLVAASDADSFQREVKGIVVAAPGSGAGARASSGGGGREEEGEEKTVDGIDRRSNGESRGSHARRELTLAEVSRLSQLFGY